jgi:N-acetylglucosamine-6-sulfatase
MEGSPIEEHRRRDRVRPSVIGRPGGAAALLLSLLLAGASIRPASPAIAKEAPDRRGAGRPNVVVIVSDDQRWDSLRDMPAVMSSIVARGVRFPNAMVPTSLCCPSRSSLLLGQYAHSTGVWSNVAPTGGWVRFFGNGHESSNLATWLHDDGYRTALIGKYLNEYELASPFHVPLGWDVWHAFDNPGYYDYDLHDGSALVHYGTEPQDYSTDVLAGLAGGFISGTDPGTPLFLYLTPYGTHGIPIPAPRHVGACAALEPWRPPSYDERNVSDKPAWVRARSPLSWRMRQVLDDRRRQACEALLSVDDMVGTVIDALASSGRLEDTLIVYMSDNGYLWGEHRIRGKNVPYDAATRIPLAIRFDGLVSAGMIDRRLALNLDVTRTIVDLTNVTPGLLQEGISLLRSRERRGFVLEAATSEKERPAYCGWRSAHAWFAHYAGGEEEFYDLKKDPWELLNRVKRHGVHEQVDRFRRHAKDACSPLPPGFHW